MKKKWILWKLLVFWIQVEMGKGQKEEEEVKRLFGATFDKKDECAKRVYQKSNRGFLYESTNPLGPVVECSFLPDEFIDCDEPIFLPPYIPPPPFEKPPNLNMSAINRDEGKCSKMGGTRAEDIDFTNVKCRVLPCIECRGSRSFQKLVPCIRYTGHYFLSTLLYSIFLGVVAVDRFCLGYSAMAVGKLMTLGGFGIWWIVDIFLLVFGILQPADDSNWEPNY